MFLNDLSNKNRRFTKVNRWLNKEFGVSVNENSTVDQLSNAKVNSFCYIGPNIHA